MTKREKVMLTLGVDIEKSQLQSIANQLEQTTDKMFSSKKAKDYYNTIKKASMEMGKTTSAGYKRLDKPFYSKNDAKKVATDIASSFKTLDDTLSVVQMNVGKTINSITNTTNLKKIRMLGDEIENLLKDYQAISSLRSKHKSLGNQSALKSKASNAKKELEKLNKKEGPLTKDEISYQRELRKEIKLVNEALKEKAKITAQIAAIQKRDRVSSQAGLQDLIDNKILEQNRLSSETLTFKDASTLKSLLSNVKKGVKAASGGSGGDPIKVEESYERAVLAQRDALEQSKTLTSVMRDLGVPLLTLQELVSAVSQVAHYSFEYVKNLDAALTEISVVSGKTRAEVMSLTDTFIELSARTGMAIDDIAQASTIFYQQGLDDKAVEKMTEYTALFAKISGETVPQAADQLTAAINGFNYSSEQVGDVVDKMSVLAAYSAADIDELATAMTKGASAASQAGLSFDEYNAFLATMIETTREAPENIGTSLKTIMARFQQVKKAGTTEDGETDVNKVETALKSVGVQLRGTDNQLRDLGEVLRDLGPKWEALDRNTQAYLGTVIAGTRQQSRFISLMQHWDRAMELVSASENSAGAAAEMHGAAMEGLEATINNLTNAWQKLISNIVDGDSFKWIIKSLTGLVKWLGKGHSIIKIMIIAFNLFNLKTLMTNISLQKQGNSIKNLNTSWENLKQVLLGVGKVFRITKNNIDSETNALKENTAAVDENRRAKEKKPKATPEVAGGITGSTKTKGGLKGKFKNFGSKTKGVFSKGSELLGKAQTAIFAISSTVLALELIGDAMIEDAEEKKEKAQAEFSAVSEEMSAHQDFIKTVDESLPVYEKLSKKVNKSTEEINKMAEAAEALAEAAPDAILGYDKDGNPIIDSSKIENAKKKAEKERAKLAREQLGNVGSLTTAEIRKQAEEENNSSFSGKAAKATSTAGMLGAGAGALAMTALGLSNPIGWAVLAAGAGAYLIGKGLEEAGVQAQEYAIIQEKVNKIVEENKGQILQLLGVITSNSIADRSVNGVSANQRIEAASYIKGAWADARLKEIEEDIQKKLSKGTITAEKAEEIRKEKYTALGNDWSSLLEEIGEKGLAGMYKKMTELRKDAGKRTFADIEKEVLDFLNNDLKINPNSETGRSIKEAFLDGSFTGVKGGVHKALKDLEKQKESKLSLYKEGSNKYKEQESKYNKVINDTKNMTAGELGFYESIGLTENIDLFSQIIGSYGPAIKKALAGSTESAIITSINLLSDYVDVAKKKLDEIAIRTGQGNSYEDIDYDKLSAGDQEEYDYYSGFLNSSQNSLDMAWDSLAESINTPWKELHELFDEITERSRGVQSVLNDLMSGEGIDYDQWKEFTTLFDDIPLENMDLSDMDRYSKMLNEIGNSLYVENGMLYANADAVKNIGQIERDIAQEKINIKKKELKVKMDEMILEKKLVDAELEYAMTVLENAKVGKETSEEEKNALEDFNNTKAELDQWYLDSVQVATEKEVELWGGAYSEIFRMKNKLMTAMTNGEASKEEIDELQKEFETAWKNVSSKIDLSDIYKPKKGEKRSDDSYIKRLEARIEGLKGRSKRLGIGISDISLKLKTLDIGMKQINDTAGKGAKALDKYISKLSKFLDLLEHIEREEVNLEIATKLKGMQTYTAVLDRMGDQLRYVSHLIGDMTEMMANQEKEANDAAATIRKTYGDIVSFDPWGNYKVDLNKYEKLSDKHKEDLDENLKGYKELVKARDEYYKKLLDYKKQERDINQEYVDKYIDAENKLVEAVKQREKAILDNKLAAIDKEIAAINKAADARRKAREKEKQAEELSGMQTDLQRALMDSSGASATDILAIQKQIKDKQQEYADQSFDNMVSDMNQKLEEDKQLEQRLFDERLEEMDWYWDEVDRIMGEGTQSIMETMKTYMDTFNKSSEIQQTELLKGWENTFVQAVKIGAVGAKNYQKIVEGLQDEINSLVVDEDILTSGTINTGFEKRPVIKEESKGSGGSGSKHSSSNLNYNRGDPPKYVKPSDSNSKQPDLGFKGEKYYYDSSKDNQITNGLEKTGSYIAVLNKNGNIRSQNIWRVSEGREKGKLLYWKGGEGKYKSLGNISLREGKMLTKGFGGVGTTWKSTAEADLINFSNDQKRRALAYKSGGMNYTTGLAWLDGTKTKPEAVLNALETKAFLQFANDLTRIRQGQLNTANNNVVIDNISFNVESMSSVADGEKAFNAFVDKFKEIGSKQGISVVGTANRN